MVIRDGVTVTGEDACPTTATGNGVGVETPLTGVVRGRGWVVGLVVICASAAWGAPVPEGSKLSSTRTIGAASPFADVANAVDGDLATCWASDNTNMLADPLDFIIEFPEAVTLDGITVTTCRMKNQVRLTAFDVYAWAGSDWDRTPLAMHRDGTELEAQLRFETVTTERICLRLHDNVRPNHDFGHIAEIGLSTSDAEPVRELKPTGLPPKIAEVTTAEALEQMAEGLRKRPDDSVARAHLSIVEARLALLDTEKEWLAKLAAIDARTEELLDRGAPEWAVYEREALAKYVLWARWWQAHQQPDGQFGGSYEDDVELTCGWPLAVLAASDRQTLRSLDLLAEGVWNFGPISEHGYSTYTDVEHSAENTSYSQPRMAVMDWGDPKWSERCRQTTLTVARGFMAENDLGGLQFTSDWFGYRDGQPMIDEERSFGIPECAKALKPGLARVWRDGDHDVRKALLEYADTWVEAAKANGGMIPTRIAFPSGEASGVSEWFPPSRALYYHLLGCYEITGDEKYLAPVERMIEEFVVNRAVRDIPFTPKRNDREHAGTVSQIAVVASIWRTLTGDDRFDEHFERWSRRMASQMGERFESYYYMDRALDDIWIRVPIQVGAFRLPRLAIGPQLYIGWLASEDKGLLTAACRNLSYDLTDQWGPLTSWFYDKSESRVTSNDHLAHSIQTSATMLMMAYCGGPGPIEAKYPHMAVSWERTSAEFAALVTEQSRETLEVLACNLEDGPRDVTMRVYELRPGRYELTVGDETAVMRLRRHSGVRITLPSKEVQVIELTRVGGKGETEAHRVTDLPVEPVHAWNPKGAGDIASPAELHEAAPFTIMARARCDSGKHDQVILDNAARQGYHGFALSLTEDDLPRFSLRYHSVVSHVQGTKPVPVGRPFTIAGAFTGDRQRLYVDGELVAEIEYGYYTPSAGPLVIGGSWAKASLLEFSGEVEEVAFFDDAVELGQ